MKKWISLCILGFFLLMALFHGNVYGIEYKEDYIEEEESSIKRKGNVPKCDESLPDGVQCEIDPLEKFELNNINEFEQDNQLGKKEICRNDDGNIIDCNEKISKSTSEVDIFEPTNEWKVILPHQQIPPGLHVRMNLQTGLKEAKILENDESTSKAIAINPKGETEEIHLNNQEMHHDSKDTSIQTIQKNQKNQKESNEESKRLEETNEKESVSSKTSETSGDSIYNTMASLPNPPEIRGLNLHDAYHQLSKEEFQKEAIRLWKERQQELLDASQQIQDEAKRLQKLINTLIHPESTDDLIYQALIDLEWEVQDLDKAKDFNTLGGMIAIVHLQNASNYEIREAAAWVLGTAVKNYDEAKDWAINNNVIPKLIQSLEISDSTTNENLYSMHKKVLYALGSLLQFNERAQASFQIYDGLSILKRIVESPIHHEKLKLKIATIVYDLIKENPQTNDSPLYQIKAILQSNEWCNVFPSVLKSKSIILQQKILDTLHAQAPKCDKIFQKDTIQVHFQNALMKRKKQFQQTNEDKEGNNQEDEQLQQQIIEMLEKLII